MLLYYFFLETFSKFCIVDVHLTITFREKIYMTNNLYSKYINHATIVLEDDSVEDNINILEDIFDEKINVIYPLTIVFSGRNFKIKDRDALNTFINAARCMAEICEVIYERKKQKYDRSYYSTHNELKTSAKRHVYEYPDGFSISNTDELIPLNWLE